MILALTFIVYRSEFINEWNQIFFFLIKIRMKSNEEKYSAGLSGLTQNLDLYSHLM